MSKRSMVLAGLLLLSAAREAAAQAPHGSWGSLVADRSAARAGDSLTVLIYQDSKASNSTLHGSHKTTRLAGAASTNLAKTHQAQASLSNDFDGSGQTSRSDQVIAAVGVVVTDVLPNGELQVAGQQSLLVNGGRTLIRVAGRVRPSDITQDNTVLSSRMADASIVYDGAGFGQKPGIIARVLDKLGL
jgi:flagellar L-ring protein precursor FlgH